jgi:F420-0:gamma-glutamyl ligase
VSKIYRLLSTKDGTEVDQDPNLIALLRRTATRQGMGSVFYRAGLFCSKTGRPVYVVWPKPPLGDQSYQTLKEMSNVEGFQVDAIIMDQHGRKTRLGDFNHLGKNKKFTFPIVYFRPKKGEQ